MGYFKDAFAIILLKEETYKKVGNDKNAFKKFVLAYFISTYLTSLFWGTLILFGIRILNLAVFNFIIKYIVILSLFFFIFPLITLAFSLVFTFIPHVIGLALGGKPRRYLDFFKVYNYTVPVLWPITTLFNNVLGPIYFIWDLFLLYKTYKVIHRLTPRKAGWGIAINLFLFLIVVFIGVIIIFSIGRSNPEVLEAIRNNY